MNGLKITNIEQAGLSLGSLYSRFGYKKFKMSRFEELGLYTENRSFLENEKIITFSDFAGKLMALRPDVTLSIVKNADGGKTEKVYYSENVYRSVKGSSEVREILQTGLEYIGKLDSYCFAEVIALAIKSLLILSDNIVIDISHMGFLAALTQGEEFNAEVRARLADAVSAKSPHMIKKICADAGASEDTADKLCALAASNGSLDKMLPMLEKISTDSTSDEYINQLKDICKALEGIGYGKYINIDFSVINDMSYYNGLVFQGFIEGIPYKVLSGGRYDNLLRKFARDDSAVGFAVYLGKIEQFLEIPAEVDTDILLEYSPDTDTAEIMQIASRLSADSKSITVRPENDCGDIRYSEHYILTAEGVKYLA